MYCKILLDLLLRLTFYTWVEYFMVFLYEIQEWQTFLLQRHITKVLAPELQTSILNFHTY